jgi:hypothetical protein
MLNQLATILVTLSLLSYRLARCDLICKVDSSDSCTLDISGDGVNGKVNLNKIFSNGQLTVKNSGNTYQYEACKGVGCNGGSCGSDKKAKCVACQKDGKNTYGLGDIKTASCDASQSDPSKNEWTIKLSYTGGQDSRKCDFNFKYKSSESTPEMTFDQEKPQLDYHLTVMGDFDVPQAPTPKPTPSGSGGGVDPGIPGIIIIVVLIVAAVSYVVIGIIIQAAVRGASGVEVIPNVTFWKDFPFLIKDGFVFTFTYPCSRIKQSRSGLN